MSRRRPFAQGFQQFELLTEYLLTAVRRTFQSLGWQFEATDAFCFEARVPLGVCGWGEERVWVAVEPDGWVLVESECNWRFVLWKGYTQTDKNQHNIRTFFDRLNQLIVLEALGRVPGFQREEPSWAAHSTHIQELKRKTASR